MFSSTSTQAAFVGLWDTIMPVSPPRRRGLTNAPMVVVRTAMPNRLLAEKTTLLRYASFVAGLTIAAALALLILHPWCGRIEGGSSAIIENELPISFSNRPYFDLVIAVLVVGGASKEALEEIARVRRVYARYGTKVVPSGNVKPLTFKLVFVVGRDGLPPGTEVPDSGLLQGDFYHVDVREGYDHLSDKTKAIMGLSEHLRFRFLVKTDGDTFPCLSQATQHLVELPEEDQGLVYAGLLATCGKVFPKGHKLHDPEFLKATGGVLDCHPMYQQGAFYILGERIVHHLYRSRDLLTVMSVEDAMVGIWLLGVNKVILDIGGSFYCKCWSHPAPKDKLSFYHFCKTDEKIDKCLHKFGAC